MWPLKIKLRLMKIRKFNKILLSGLIVIASGVIILSLLNDGTAGLVVLSVGGLLFLLGLNEKQEKV